MEEGCETGLFILNTNPTSHHSVLLETALCITRINLFVLQVMIRRYRHYSIHNTILSDLK